MATEFAYISTPGQEFPADYRTADAVEVEGVRFVRERTCRMRLQGDGMQWFVCSECGSRATDGVFMDMPRKPSFCPSCGARVV